MIRPSQVFAGTASIVGKVVMADDSALGNAEIMLHTNDWSVNRWATSDSDGDFTFTDLDAGTYIMEFRTPWDNSSGLVTPDSVSSVVEDGATFYRDGTNGTDCSGSPCAAIQFDTANNTISGTLTKSDGSPISGAYIEAYKEMGMGWIQATTDVNGGYSISTGAGTWMISPRANYGADPSAVDWTYTKMPTRVSFSSNASPGSTKTLNFTAQSADCLVTGTVKDPDGNTIENANNYVYVSVWSREGGGQGSNAAANGSFSLMVPEGSYNLDVHAWGTTYGSPASKKFTVKDADNSGSCDGYSAGNITLLEKNATITGQALDTNGDPVANTHVNAWMFSASGWADTQTDSSGNYSLAVTAGTWIVSISQDPGMYGSGYGGGTTYINDQDPLQVVVADSATSSGNNFTLKIANSTISGRIVDSDGSTLTSVEMGYAYVETGASGGGPGPMMYSSMGASVKNGVFTLKVPAGSYSVGVSLPPGAGYCTGSSAEVTTTANATVSASITMTQATGTIQGSLKKDSDSGDTITGVQAEVFANSGTMNFSMATVDSSTGAYTMSVCPGDWYLGYWIDPSLTDGEDNSYLRQPPSDNKVIVTASETVTKNVIVKKADATIAGTVTDPDGSAMAGAWVMLDTRSNDTAGSFDRGSMFSNGAMTDSTGAYSIKVPSGTAYNVSAYLPAAYSYLNPKSVSVTPTTGQTLTVNLQFKNADATLTGTVTQSGTAMQAFISAWSEDGGYSGTMAGSNGVYSLSLSSGVNWHVKAMYESGTTFYRSDEQILTPTTGSNSLDLDLSNSGTMPESTTVTYTATNQKTITLSDGTTINIPAGALASSGNVTVTVTPKAQLPTQSLATPVNIGYDIKALDSNGTEITTNFSSNVTIVMPYTEAQLTTLGITENDLLAGYWDEATNSWRTADNVTIDTDNNTITVTINHFTQFAPFSAGTLSASSGSSLTSTTSSTATNTASVPSETEFGVEKGGTVNKGAVIAIVSAGTVPLDSYVSVTTYRKQHPYKVGSLWQASHVYDIWYKTMDNSTKIYFPDKSAIWAIRYTIEELESLPEFSLKMAYSADSGVTWRLVPSILDTANKTVATMTKDGGYYMLVSGYGGGVISKEISQETLNQDADVSSGENESPPKEEQRQTVEKEEFSSLPEQKSSLFRRIWNKVMSLF